MWLMGSLFITHMKNSTINETDIVVATDLVLHKILEFGEVAGDAISRETFKLKNTFESGGERHRIPFSLFSEIMHDLNEKRIIQIVLELSKEESNRSTNIISFEFIVQELSQLENEIVNLAKSGVSYNEKLSETSAEKTVFLYNPETGDGNFKSKKFRLTDNKPYRKIFDACFAKRGRKLIRQDIIEIIGLSDMPHKEIDMARVMDAFEGANLRRKSDIDVKITNTVNDIAKEIRRKTGLDTDEFVNNSGSLTLNI